MFVVAARRSGRARAQLGARPRGAEARPSGATPGAVPWSMSEAARDAGHRERRTRSRSAIRPRRCARRTRTARSRAEIGVDLTTVRRRSARRPYTPWSQGSCSIATAVVEKRSERTRAPDAILAPPSVDSRAVAGRSWCRRRGADWRISASRRVSVQKPGDRASGSAQRPDPTHDGVRRRIRSRRACPASTHRDIVAVLARLRPPSTELRAGGNVRYFTIGSSGRPRVSERQRGGRGEQAVSRSPLAARLPRFRCRASIVDTRTIRPHSGDPDAASVLDVLMHPISLHFDREARLAIDHSNQSRSRSRPDLAYANGNPGATRRQRRRPPAIPSHGARCQASTRRKPKC
jgi:hypothetical protein